MPAERKAYWRRVHARALREALQATGLDSAERAVIRIIATIVGVILLWLAGDIERHLWLRILGTTAILLIFPVVYLRKLGATPGKMGG
jgi:uncharacterized protein (DUF983 family)